MTMHRDLVTPRGLFLTGLAAALLVAGPSAALATETEEPDQPESGFEVPAYDVTPWLPAGTFDLQAHRGGLALISESTPEAFANALEMGVTTLELDTHVTSDGAVLVWHDRQIFDHLCRDTEPAFEEDPDFPYVGQYITDLTLEQVQTLECNYQAHQNWPDQEVHPQPIIELHEVFELIHEHEAYDVTLNIETKVEAGAPEETQPRDVFVPAVVSEIEEHGMVEQSTIQSFDWGALQMVAELNPDLPRVALTNYAFLQIGEPGASPWLGGLDADDFDGDLVAMAVELGVEAISPVHGFPQDGAIGEEDYEPYVTSAMVEDAHAAGVSVIPWTVNDTNTLRYLIETGVDGIITDRPDALRDVMSEYGIALPEPRPRGEDPAPGDDEPDDPDPTEEPTADPAGDSTDEPTQDPTQGPIGDPTEKPTEEESLTPTPGDETASEEPTPSPTAVAAEGTDETSPGGDAKTTDSGLAATGATTGWVLAAAVLLLGLGGLVLYRSHRKRDTASE